MRCFEGRARNVQRAVIQVWNETAYWISDSRPGKDACGRAAVPMMCVKENENEERRCRNPLD